MFKLKKAPGRPRSSAREELKRQAKDRRLKDVEAGLASASMALLTVQAGGTANPMPSDHVNLTAAKNFLVALCGHAMRAKTLEEARKGRA